MKRCAATVVFVRRRARSTGRRDEGIAGVVRDLSSRWPAIPSGGLLNLS